MTTNWIVLAESATMAATAVLLIVFISVYRQRAADFSILWIIGWGIYVTRFAFGIYNSLAPSTLLTIAYHEVSILSAIILFYAALKKERAGHWRMYGTIAFALVSIWIIFSAYFIEDVFWVALPTFFFFGAVQIATGYYFLRANQQSRHIGGYVAGWGFVFWGLHKLDYPFMRPLEWFAPIGYLIGAFLSILVGVGILMLLFEQSEEREKSLAKALAKDKIALQNSEERFKFAMAASQDGIWDWDVVTGKVYYSPAYFAMLGYEDGKFPDHVQTWLDMLHPDDREKTLQANNECIENITDRFEVEFRMMGKDGEWHWILGQGKAVTRGARMRALRMVGTHTDITARKHAEEEIRQFNTNLEQRVAERTSELRETQAQLVRQEKLAVLGQVAGGVGHELRNPLGVISNAVYFLKIAQPNADPKVQEYLDLIEQQVYLSDIIVSDLLDFTRIKSAEGTRILLTEAICQTLERFPPPEAIHARVDPSVNTLEVYADLQHVVQILGNLTLNAFQAMLPQGGTLTISASRQGEMARIDVQDTGTGIASEHMPKLFEPLFTTKTKGIGLGLAVSHKLAKAHGGDLTAQSTPGVGSVFSLYLPVSAPILHPE